MWYKGNLHCHSTNSDGKSSPARVAAYFKSLGYNFLGISDHNQLTPLKEYGVIFDDNFIGIPCCEYSGAKNCHVLAVNVKTTVKPLDREMGTWEKHKILQDGINKTHKAKGIPILCHPSWEWTYTEEEVQRLKNCRLFEICNASPDCNSIPIPGYSPNEYIWDKLLSANHRYMGIASDDAHFYYRLFHPRMSVGGKGWIMVRAEKLTKSAILNAIFKGDFYATTGIILKEYIVLKNKIEIVIQRKGREKVSFEFIGNKGKVLKQVIGKTAEYNFTGKEKYIRVRMASTGGPWAWTQPIFI